MITVVITYVISLLLESILIGVASFGIVKKLKLKNYLVFATILSFILIVILTNLWYPAFLAMDLTVTINNKEIADFIGTSNIGMEVMELGTDWFSIISYFIQTIIAYLVGCKIIGKKIS